MEELRIEKIMDGTVIDHIPNGNAINVIRILGVGSDSTASIGINVPSSSMGSKDIVKIEGKFLSTVEIAKLAMVAPKATINIIKKYKVERKLNVEVPDKIVGIVKCINARCITLSREPIKSEFYIISSDPIVIKCVYCEIEMDGSRIHENII